MQIRTLIQDTLSLIGNITQEVSFPQSEQKVFHSNIQSVQERLDRNVPYVAIVGQFSYGKSTFINAILGEEILLSKNRPTTNIATYIKYGPKLNANVELTNGDSYTYSLRYTKEKRRTLSYLKKNGKSKPKNIVDFIHLFTTDSGLTENIEKVIIEHPSPYLKKGLVLIDTPGLHAAGKKKHSQITSLVMTQIIDACIVMLDANQVAPQEYLSVVKELIKENPVKMFFVLNKMDAVFQDTENQEEQMEQFDELVDVAKIKLKKGLNISDPIIYPLSSKLASLIKNINKDGEFLKSHKLILNGFQKFVDVMMHFVTDEYNIHSVKTAADVLRMTTDKLQSSLQNEISQVKHIIANLNQHQISSIENFSARIEKDVFPKFEKKANNVLKATIQKIKTTTLNKVLRRINSMISNAVNAETLKSIATEKIPAYHNSLNDLISRDLKNPIISEYAVFCEEVPKDLENNIDNTFNEMFKELRVLDPSFHHQKDDYFSNKILPRSKNTINISVGNIFEEANDKKVGGATGGAITGAVIGSFILTPGIGTVIGGAIGGFFGSLFGPNLDELKTKVKDDICGTVRDHWHNKVVPATEKTINTNIQGMLDNGRLRINQYAKNYNKTINKMIRNRENELDKLSQRQKQAQEFFNSCKNCKNKLEQAFMDLEQRSHHDVMELQKTSTLSLQRC